MSALKEFKIFEWDQGNVKKSYKKHGVTPSESEEIFLDRDLKIIKDVKRSQKEDRFIAIGKSFRKKTLFVVYTLRKNIVRIISARIANRKERKKHEKAIKENS